MGSSESRALAAAPARANTTAPEALDAPSPGTYWRVREDVAARYDRRTRVRAMPAGTVLMLAGVEMADGAPHVYRFAPHPAWPEREQSESHIHADDLYTLFERAPDGESVRARELEGLLLEMDQVKDRMLQMPPPASAPASARLPHAPVGTPGQALASAEQVIQLAQHAQSLKEDAERRTQWIQTHSRLLGEHGGTLARFHQERAQAALARAHAQLEGVASLLRTVENLRLYTGEDVEVLQLRDGVPASPEARVTLYQDLLALDEEALVLLDQGGLDHTRTDSLAQALEDPALLRRMIPAERGAVLARFRATHKEFLRADADGPAAAVMNQALNEASQRVRLLVRDGERLWLITADAALAGITQLMPSAAEQAGYFETDRINPRKPPERITREHLAYARAQRAQLGALDGYGKALIVLWGLHDRTGMFESAHIPRFTSWLDPAFQAAHLHLVSHDSLLGVARPTFSAWQQEQNAYLAAGSIVAVDLAQAFLPERAPGAYYQGGYELGRWRQDRKYAPKVGEKGVFVGMVRSDADGLYVDVPCAYVGYQSHVRRPEVNIKLQISRHRQPGRHAEGLLVLDRVRAEDLDYYLESREQRRAYAHYVTLFRVARRWVAERDTVEAPMRAYLRQAVQEASLPHDPDRLEGQITEALAVARLGRREQTAPPAGSRAFPSYAEAALGALHAQLADHSTLIRLVEDWAEKERRALLRLVLTGRGQWRVYLEPTDAEHDARLGAPVHATVAHVCLTMMCLAVDVAGRELLRQRAGEQVIHDWPGAAAWLQKEWPYRVDYSGAVARLAGVGQGVAALVGEGDAQAVMLEAVRQMRDTHRGQVRRMPLNVPIGTALRKGKPLIVMATTDALGWAYHVGDEPVKQACRDETRSIYLHPENWVKALDAKGLEWGLRLVDLDEAGEPLSRQQGSYFSRDALGQKAGSERVTITSLAPGAREIFPWLSKR